MNTKSNSNAGSGCSSHELFSDLCAPWIAVDGDYDSLDIYDAKGGFVCTPHGETVGDVATRAGLIADAPQTLAALNQLRDAVRAYRDAKGRYHTQLAYDRLLSLLPENVEDTREARQTLKSKGITMTQENKKDDQPAARESSLSAPAGSAVRSGGMTVEEAKEYLRRRNEETILGRSWDDISKMQQGRRK